MGAVNKFGKWAGGATLNTPAANSVTTDKIFDGGVGTADIAAKAVTAAKLNADVITSATGLAGGDGAAIEFAPTNCTAAVVAIGSDSMIIIDANDANAPRKEAIADVVSAAAGTQATSALTATSGVLKVAPSDNAIDVSADSLIYATAAGTTKKDLVSDVVSAVAGVTATTGLSATSGVLTAAIKIAHLVADEKSSLFIETGEFDFSGSASAVDTKKIDAMAAKGQLLCALVSMSQVANGTTSAVISISSAASAATKMTGDLTITLADTVYQNKVNNCMIMWPVTGANSIVASGGDVYFYAAASAGRSAGKLHYVLVFMKTA